MGKKGARIRAIQEDSGASCNFAGGNMNMSLVINGTSKRRGATKPALCMKYYVLRGVRCAWCAVYGTACVRCGTA